jgi:hypothetical protein
MEHGQGKDGWESNPTMPYGEDRTEPITYSRGIMAGGYFAPPNGRFWASKAIINRSTGKYENNDEFSNKMVHRIAIYAQSEQDFRCCSEAYPDPADPLDIKEFAYSGMIHNCHPSCEYPGHCGTIPYWQQWYKNIFDDFEEVRGTYPEAEGTGIYNIGDYFGWHSLEHSTYDDGSGYLTGAPYVWGENDDDHKWKVARPQLLHGAFISGKLIIKINCKDLTEDWGGACCKQHLTSGDRTCEYVQKYVDCLSSSDYIANFYSAQSCEEVLCTDPYGGEIGDWIPGAGACCRQHLVNYTEDGDMNTSSRCCIKNDPIECFNWATSTEIHEDISEYEFINYKFNVDMTCQSGICNELRGLTASSGYPCDVSSGDTGCTEIPDGCAHDA